MSEQEINNLLNIDNLNNGQINNINGLVQNHEALIKSLQCEVDFYKKEHETLKLEISKNVVNRETNQFSGLENVQKNSDNVVNNLNQQIRILTEEKDTLQHLWKTSEKTIANLEIETAEYKRQLRHPNSILELKKGYMNAIKVLESTLLNTRNELDQQNKLNVTLIEEKVIIEKQLNDIEKKYQEILADQAQSLEKIRIYEQSLDNIKYENKNLLNQRNDLEKSSAKLNVAIKEHTYRENKALEKIQETLSITELAFREKDAAILRENEIREERDHLASTIDQVMNDASIKMEKEINAVTKEYSEKIYVLENSILKMRVVKDTQLQQIEYLEKNIKQLDLKLENSLKNNNSLDSELQLASQAIIEMEMKLEAFENLMNREQETNKLCEARNIELQELLMNSKQLRERWKEAVNDTIEKLQNELKILQQKYSNLQLENQQIKLKNSRS